MENPLNSLFWLTSFMLKLFDKHLWQAWGSCATNNINMLSGNRVGRIESYFFQQLKKPPTPLFFPSFASSALARSSHSVCADERIGPCMSQHPALESQKRSADHYAVQNPHRGEAESKTKRHNNPNKQRKSHPVKDELRRGWQLMCQ